MTHHDPFTTRLSEAIIAADGGPPATRRLLGRAIADTLAVAAPGFAEPVVQSSLAAYAGSSATLWSGARCESREAAVFINAVAAHALDFDDVLLDSTIHASTVILPAILEIDHPVPPAELIAAFAAGMIAARAIGRRVGAGHYHKGWHATGTFGALVAAAAAARLHRLNPAATRAALGLAAAQAGGMKLNFGTMAKPCHAGFAATAGLRAVRLAQAGVTAASDIFVGPFGFAAIYGTGDGDPTPDDDAFALRPDRVSLKLYPCCYAAHRLIGVALDARDRLGPAIFAPDIRAVLHVPAGSVDLLRDDDPKTPLAAKFSAKYCIASALADGPPSLATFTEAALRRPGLADLLDRITIIDDPAQPSGGDIEYGTVHLDLQDPTGATRHRFARGTIPGAPDDVAPDAAVRHKIADCLAGRAGLSGFAEATGHPFAPLALVHNEPDIATWLPPAAVSEQVAAQ